MKEKIDVSDDGVLRDELKRELFCARNSLAPQLMRHSPFTFQLLPPHRIHQQTVPIYVYLTIKNTQFWLVFLTEHLSTVANYHGWEAVRRRTTDVDRHRYWQKWRNTNNAQSLMARASSFLTEKSPDTNRMTVGILEKLDSTCAEIGVLTHFYRSRSTPQQQPSWTQNTGGITNVFTFMNTSATRIPKLSTDKRCLGVVY